jgi:hypothetical protein
MQRGEAATAREGKEEPQPAQRGGTPVERFAIKSLPVQPIARDAEHDREQVGRKAEQHEKEVGQPRPERANQVRDWTGLAGGREGGVATVVADERCKQDQGQRTEDPQRAFTQAAGHGRRLVAVVGSLRFCLSQDSSPDFAR